MHISEGILPLKWAAIWYAAVAPFLIKATADINKKLKVTPYFKPLLGLIGALIFVISCMPVPVPMAGSCSHPAGTGVSAILLGPFISIFVTAVALLIQALFLTHGGISTLGGNIMSMGVAGSFAAYLVYKFSRKLRLPLFFCGFAAGLAADWATYAMTSFELAAGLRTSEPIGRLFVNILFAFIPTQLPLGILEGFITGGMLVFVFKRRPEIFTALGAKVCLVAAVTALSLLSGQMLFAQDHNWSGVDESVVERIASEHGRQAKTPLINTDKGDLLLFVFLLAGTVGGFVIGYTARGLFGKVSCAPASPAKGGGLHKEDPNAP